MEKWKDVKGFKGLYKISDQGRVRSLVSQKILKPGKISTGYLQVILTKKKVKHSRTVHRLVAESFLNHYPNRVWVVDHIDEDKANNKLSNLRIIHTKENAARGRKPSTSKYVGVCWNSANRKWVAYRQVNGKDFYLGSHETEEEAKEAYEKMSYKRQRIRK